MTKLTRRLDIILPYNHSFFFLSFQLLIITSLQRLKATLWSKIGPLVDYETASNLNGVNTSAQFIGALTELVWSQLETCATDLESFAGHASRSTINTDDVLLLTRRNEGLEDMIRKKIDDTKAEKAATGKGAKR